MADLTEFLPQQSETVNLIYDWHKRRGDAEPQRGYLGASILGEPCLRYLWYVFRGVVSEEISGRIYRLFETGDLEEARFVKELRGIGYEVWEVNPATGEQFEVSALGGHISGHLDAVTLGVVEAPKTPHLGEFKTHKDSSFKELKNKGVQASKPIHYAQMQVYMGLQGLTRALYLARNKDTDELYAERVYFERAHFDALMGRGRQVVEAAQPLERVANRPDDFRCKFCDAFTLCWGHDRDGEEPQAAAPISRKTCKSCCHSTPETDREGAVWSCSRYETDVDPEVGQECPTHLLLPRLLPLCTPEDADVDWIEFKNRDGTVWRHGVGEGAWTTDQLIAGRGPLDSAPPELPEQLQDDGQPSLVERFTWADNEMVWDGPSHELADMLDFLGMPSSRLLEQEPLASQVDETVNAVAYHFGGSDFLIVNYKQDDHAAIWKGKV